MSLRPALWRQGASYGLIGALQLLLDWGCFVGLSAIGLGTVPSNILGRIGGAILGFWLNGAVTFRTHAGGQLGWSRFRKFLVSWTLMSVFSTIAVRHIDLRAGLDWAWILKPVIDIMLAAAGFVVSRYWIYR